MSTVEDIVAPVKVCRRCGYEGTDFYPQRRVCRPCLQAESLEYQRTHPEVVERRTSRWKSKNQERIRESSRKRYAERRAYLKYRYGIDDETYRRLSDKQDGVCGICRQLETQESREHLSVDHDHETGLIRGLLCARCNSALGMFNDDIGLVSDALEYLERSRVA